MFRGRYQHTIDPKGRLSVPAKFRDALAQYAGSLVVVPNEHSLEVHPLEEWERIEEKLNAQRDPAHPLPVFAIGYGADADMNVLNQMAKLTGGQAVASNDPGDLASAMAKIFLAAHLR